MRIIFSILIAAATSSLMAQDLDFPDFRQKKDNFSKISDKDIRADVASFALAAVDESIGKAVLRTLPITDYSSNTITYEGENIKVSIKTGTFIAAKHKLMMSETHLLRIDGKPYYGGIIGQPPHTTIESVTVIVGKDTVAIPPTA